MKSESSAMLRRTLSFIVVAIVPAFATGCKADSTEPLDPCSCIVTVSLTPNTLSAKVGETKAIAVQVYGGSTTAPPTFDRCESFDTELFTASRDGANCQVVAKAVGNAKLRATITTGQVVEATVIITAAVQ